MNIAQKIEELKKTYRNNQAINRDKSLQRTTAEKLHYERIAKEEKTIRENKEAISKAKKTAFNARLAPFQSFGKAVKTRLAERSKENKGQALISNTGGFNSLYHGSTGKGKGSNIFTQTSGSNPFNFSKSEAQPKTKVKSKTIYKY